MEDFAPEKKKRYLDFYMGITQQVSQMSQARRLKVGSILVKDGNIISFGWNGMPSGWDNNCEYEVYHEQESDLPPTLTTKPEVIHSESNCLMKVTRSNQSSEGSTMFLTHAPCIHCAKQIYTAGIKVVYYDADWRSKEGIDFLNKCGVIVNQIL